jgi:hypothetical protein
MRRLWDVPKDVRTVHLCACSPLHAAEIGHALEEAGIVWWEKPPSAGVLAFLERESQLFVDRTRLDEAREIARGIIGNPEG